MKKLFIFTFIFCIFLSGCTANKTEQSSIETSPGVTNETSPGVTTEIHVDDGDMPEEWNTFSCEKTEDFVAWIKSEGKLNVGCAWEPKYPANKAFMKWAKEQTEIPFPVLTGKGYYVHVIDVLRGTEPDDTGYRVVFYEPNKELVPPKGAMLEITMLPLSDQELQSGLETIVREFLKDYPSIELKSGGESKFGEYWCADYKNNVNGAINTNAYFIVSNCLVQVSVSDGCESVPWTDEYFNYFDFKTVPLK